jgi:hypothetical protein
MIRRLLVLRRRRPRPAIAPAAANMKAHRRSCGIRFWQSTSVQRQLILMSVPKGFSFVHPMSVV